MSKIEALKYICDNYHGAQGGFQMSCLVKIIIDDKEIYEKNELTTIILEMNNY